MRNETWSVLEFVKAQVREDRKHIGPNYITFSFTTNVPVMTKSSRVLIYGLYLHGQAPGPLPLLPTAADIRRAGKCQGLDECAFATDTRVPSGARDSEKVYLTLEVECQKLARILSVTICSVGARCIRCTLLRRCTRRELH
jgi:hypothetical protein